jgi:hypothetical protein
MTAFFVDGIHYNVSLSYFMTGLWLPAQIVFN